MPTIRQADREALRWIQAGARGRDFDLLAGDAVLARLRWAKTSGSLALAESEDGRFSFKRTGFLSPKVTVRAPGSASNAAIFKPNWEGDGTLELPDGRRFRWANTNFWQSEWAFAEEGGEGLVHFRPRLDAHPLSTEVRVARRAFVRVLELPLLALLGLYLLILMADERDAIAAAAAAS